MIHLKTAFRKSFLKLVSHGLYWVLWMLVIALLMLAPENEIGSSLIKTADVSQSPHSTAPVVSSDIQKTNLKPQHQESKSYSVSEPEFKLTAPQAMPPKEKPLPPAWNSVQKLPKLKVQKRSQAYPNSNELGQIRLDAAMKTSSSLPIELNHGADGMPVALRLRGPVKGLWLQAENEPAVGDLKGLVAQLTASATTDREKADAIFAFVVNDLKDWYFPAQGSDLTVEDLSVLIWNFGFGFCYDLGRLLAGLWAEAGLRSRIVGWAQHSVAEAYYDNGWHLYDPQHRSFYEKTNGQIASFEELQKNPKLFYQNLNLFGLDAIGYPPHHLAHWYKAAKPNFQDSAERNHWRVEKDFRINLRAGETMDILYTQPGPTYHPDSWHQYYGEMTLRKDPPWPRKGRQIYAPEFLKLPAKWESVRTPAGKQGFAIHMKNPFIFTEAWLKVPGFNEKARYWIHAWDRTVFGGRLVGGNAIFSKHIAGSNAFTIIVQPDQEGKSAQDHGLDRAQIHTSFQLSPIGLPQLKAGKNRWPFTFESGTPHVSLWYLERSPDLAITGIKTETKNPRPGHQISVLVEITNKGNAVSSPTSLTLHNNVTAFLSETIEKVGIQTVPPIKPGESVTVPFPWVANIRMSWYGQNPYVQLFDAWLDMEGDRPDPNLANNRLQNYIMLAKEDGTLPELPGYLPVIGGH